MNSIFEDDNQFFARDVYSRVKQLDNLDYESWIYWKINIQLTLRFFGLDFALKEDKPNELIDTSSAEAKAKYEKWLRSDRLSLLLMKHKMADHIYGYLSLKTNSGNAKQIFDALNDTIMDDERIRAPSLLEKLVSIRYDGQGNVRQHLFEMSSLANRLRAVDVGIPDYLINQLALNSLPSEFEPVRLAYIMQKEKWGLTRLIRMCADLEDMIHPHNRVGSVLGKRGETGDGDFSDNQQGNGAKKRSNVKCFSCGQKGHFAKNCWQATN